MSRVITPEAIASYPNVFVPRAQSEDQDPKYSVALVFLTETQALPDFKAMKKAALDVAKEKWGAKAAEMIRGGKIRFPFRDDAEEKGYPEGSVFVNARGTRRPGVVSIYPDPNNDGRPTPITNEEDIYPGCIVRASISFFAYDVSGNRGVGAGLNNLQKLRDGTRLDSSVRAIDEFDADASAVADLSDLQDEAETDEDELDLDDI